MKQVKFAALKSKEYFRIGSSPVKYMKKTATRALNTDTYEVISFGADFEVSPITVAEHEHFAVYRTIQNHLSNFKGCVLDCQSMHAIHIMLTLTLRESSLDISGVSIQCDELNNTPETIDRNELHWCVSYWTEYHKVFMSDDTIRVESYNHH